MQIKDTHILITNDDGINAKGLRLLIERARQFAKVTVVAPDSPQSAKSHSITQHLPIEIKTINETENYSEYSCSGTPVDCVKIAIHEIMPEKPDIILSGINHGINTSISVLYSGTMAAAIEGSINGITSCGFSVDSYNFDADFSNASEIIDKIIKYLIENKLPKNTSLNVNFPNIEHKKPAGYKICRATKGTWQEKFVQANNPFDRNTFWISGEFKNFEPNAKDTDEYALSQNYVSVVPIKVDFTNYDFIDNLKENFI